MATQSLLFCRDPDVVRILRPMLDELGLGPEVCSVTDSALALLQDRKYNPVIIDCDQMDNSGELLRRLRESPANRDSVALGIIGMGTQVSEAFALGANLVIRKPVDSEEAGKILRTARSLVTRMRRRFLRHVVHTLAYVNVDGIDESPMLLDIGEGGMALQALDAMEQHRAYSIRFCLPGHAEEFSAVAAAVWCDSSGRIGLRFLGMTATCRRRMKEWLEGRGATGPADLPHELTTADDERVALPLQLTPGAHAIAGAAVDLLIVASAVALFGLILVGMTGEIVPSPNGYPALLLGCVFWLLYRFVFFGALSQTPGGHAAARLSNRLLAVIYNRERSRLSCHE